MSAFDRLNFTEPEARALVAAARAAYAEGEAAELPQVTQWRTAWEAVQQAAAELVQALEGDRLDRTAQHRLKALRKKIGKLPDVVVAQVQAGTLPGTEEPAFEPGADPLSVLRTPDAGVAELRDAALSLTLFELAFNVFGQERVQDEGEHYRIQFHRLTRPQRRSWETNKLIGVVARAYSEKTGLPPTLNVDAYADAPTRGGGFADLLRAVVMRTQLGLDPDAVVRKAGHLRESGSLL
jgi:hypothetical protein